MGSLLKRRDDAGAGSAADQGGGAVPARGPHDIAGAAITGRAMLVGGREFACTAYNVTLASAEIVADITVSVGQVVVCYLEGVGIIPGKIVRSTERGFVMALQLAEAQRDRIAGRLEWHSNRIARDAQLRAAPRIVPIHTAVEVRLGERIVLSGKLLNISMSGAAIDLGTQALPFTGARVRVGGRFASVVRLWEAGIAVQFDEPFPSDYFDERVRP